MFGTATRSLARSARLLQPMASSSRLATPLALPSRLSPATRPPLALALSRRPFSTTLPPRGQGETDVELSNRLAQEIAFEKENNAAMIADNTAGIAEPDFLSAFRKAGVWRIEEKPGMDEIFLTREFGNEHIRILVSVGDIDTSGVGAEMGEEEAPENEEEEEDVAAFPVRMAITISKPNNGAMTIEAVAQDGELSIDNISFLKDNKIAEELTAEADWARRGIYVGPQFDTLDEGVQAQFDAFLAERGIDSDLALFIPNFAEFKEQKEYCLWLQNVKEFVDA